MVESFHGHCKTTLVEVFSYLLENVEQCPVPEKKKQLLAAELD
jgi:hypothetical protein